VLELPKLELMQLKAPKFKNSLSAIFNLPKLVNLKTLETPLYPLRLSLGHTVAPLRFVTLKEAKLKELPLEFGELKSLEELHLPNNLLTDLPASFKSLHNLKRLNLDHNKFERFPEVLAQLPRLKHLSLDYNGFSEQEIERIQRYHHITVS
jgi:leucine-rich repeat protein SHOC2